MSWISETWRRLRSVGRRAGVEQRLDEELQFHVEQQTAKNLRAGMTPDEARRQAFIKFGAVEQMKEATRDEFRASRIEDLARDVRYVVRSLRRAPGFTVVAVLTIALGIGATTAVFSVVNGVLIKPLPYPDAEELVDLAHVAPGLNLSAELNVDPTQFFTYQDHNRTFREIGLWARRTATVMEQGYPEQVVSLPVTSGTLPALGVPPALGRWFSAEDAAPGAPETVVLTHGYWQRRHGGDKAIVGTSISIDSQPHQVIGVMPEDFRFLHVDADLILASRIDRNTLRLGSFSYRGIARLRPGVPVSEANADVARMIPIWLDAWPLPPGVNSASFGSAGFAPALRQLKLLVVGNVGNVLWVLMGTIGIVLLIACANVANLLLVRAEGRQQELAIRSALGAGAGRIARVLLVESVTLGLVGGALGLVLAFGGVRLLIAAGPASLPRLGDIVVDPVVLMFAVVISLASGIVFGLIPAVRRTSPDLTRELRGSDRTSSRNCERRRARNTLVVVQVSLATVLLVASGLMMRSFAALSHVQPGFADAEHVQLLNITIPASEISDPERVFNVQADMLDRMAAIPGVSMASLVNSAPMQADNRNQSSVFVEDQAATEGKIPPVWESKSIAPGYFQTLGTPLVAGRDLEWNDIHTRRPVALVSERVARETWGDPAAAIGKRIGGIPNTNSPWREVIGVAANVYDDGLHALPTASVYWPWLMEHFGPDPGLQVIRSVTFVIRSDRAGTESLLADIREAVRSVNGNLPLAQVRTLGELYERSLAPMSFTLVMLAIAATMALLLSIVGVYGVLSYTVTQRTREIGIRAALGAPMTGLRAMFVRDGLVLTGAGVVCGLLAAGALTQVMTSLLFGVSALDPITYVAVAVVLAVAAALASYIPARRATAVDPVEVLRAP